MDDELPVDAVPALSLAADRLDQLADTAELMGDDDHAIRLRTDARHHRLRAMALLDD